MSGAVLSSQTDSVLSFLAASNMSAWDKERDELTADKKNNWPHTSKRDLSVNNHANTCNGRTNVSCRLSLSSVSPVCRLPTTHNGQADNHEE